MCGLEPSREDEDQRWEGGRCMMGNKRGDIIVVLVIEV
jgi:hypothetical protein